MAKYKGNYRPVSGGRVLVKVEPRDIYQLTRIFEGYSHLGWAVPLDSSQGIVSIYTTSDNYPEVLKVLTHLDIAHQVINEN